MKVLKDIQDKVRRNLTCHHPDADMRESDPEIPLGAECDGDDCIRCSILWIIFHHENAQSKRAPNYWQTKLYERLYVAVIQGLYSQIVRPNSEKVAEVAIRAADAAYDEIERKRK